MFDENTIIILIVLLLLFYFFCKKDVVEGADPKENPPVKEIRTHLLKKHESDLKNQKPAKEGEVPEGTKPKEGLFN